MPVGFYPPFVLLDEARRCHVAIEKPLVTRSMARTTAHGMSIQLGLNLFSILSSKDSSSIIAARETRPFESALDFKGRTHVNRRALQHLVLAGAFDDLGTPETVAADLGLDPDDIRNVAGNDRNPQLHAVLGEIAGIGYPVSASLAILLDLATTSTTDSLTPAQVHAPILRSTQLRTWPHGSNVWVQASWSAFRRRRPNLANGSSLSRWKTRKGWWKRSCLRTPSASMLQHSSRIA